MSISCTDLQKVPIPPYPFSILLTSTSTPSIPSGPACSSRCLPLPFYLAWPGFIRLPFKLHILFIINLIFGVLSFSPFATEVLTVYLITQSAQATRCSWVDLTYWSSRGSPCRANPDSDFNTASKSRSVHVNSYQQEAVMDCVDLLLTHDDLFHNCISALADIEYHHKKTGHKDSYTAADKGHEDACEVVGRSFTAHYDAQFSTRSAQQHSITTSQRAKKLSSPGSTTFQRNQGSLNSSTATTLARAFRVKPNSTKP